MAEYKIGVRVDVGGSLIIGVIIRADDYFYIDHRSSEDLADIAEKFGHTSIEWFDMLQNLNRLVETGADLKPLGEVYMESPWNPLADASAEKAVGEYFKLSRPKLRISVEGDRNRADYVLLAESYVSRGAIDAYDIAPAIAHTERLKMLMEASHEASADHGPPLGNTIIGPLPDPVSDDLGCAIAACVSSIQASASASGVRPLDCLSATLSSLLGYDNWAKSSSPDAAIALSR